jgi:peptidoglycan/xylan/chitin deacetylase (PgdA/CDA1 family)
MNLKDAILSAARPLGIAALARLATGSHLRILAYHGLWVTPGVSFGNCTFIAPEQFERRMARLKQSRLPVISLADAVDGLARGDLPKAAVVITIDDAWVSTFTHMLPVLERYELPATLYATTWYAGRALPVVNQAVAYFIMASGRRDLDRSTAVAKIEALPVNERLSALRRLGAELGVDEAWLQLRQFNIMSAEELAEAGRRGLDIQLHTHRHIEVADKVDRLPSEIAENRAFLEAATGRRSFDHFCFPSGSTHPRAAALLAAQGVRSATLDEAGLNPPGTDPYALRRLLDGRSVSDPAFDAYLSGIHHFAERVRAPFRRARRETGRQDLPAMQAA